MHEKTKKIKKQKIKKPTFIKKETNFIKKWSIGSKLLEKQNKSDKMQL